ncbi:MAG: hypothetical protein OJJ21_22085 [Ferrovibrio sp.]|uniref:hypothetical protein n=1 Tax=Ferrovibrio sp. TaxID=1917215 RepID=UPI00262842C8|nr:hypothetical protein [Ferrovibrio sp.]MCW0236303.1 hypothetical protein [Ferrovibrio sp.]
MQKPNYWREYFDLDAELFDFEGHDRQGNYLLRSAATGTYLKKSEDEMKELWSRGRLFRVSVPFQYPIIPETYKETNHE